MCDLKPASGGNNCCEGAVSGLHCFLLLLYMTQQNWNDGHTACLQVDIFDATIGGVVVQLTHELMTAIPSRCCVHPQLSVLAAATGSGRVHVYRQK